MARIAEAIFSYTAYQCGIAMLDFHQYIFQVISQSRETCSTGTLSMESSSVSDRVLNYSLPGADQRKFSLCSVQGKSVTHKPFA